MEREVLKEKRIAIVTTHPIQYNAPWFRLLANEPGIKVKVFYTWEQSASNAKYDPEFNRVIEWDIPLLDGYDYTFVKNTSTAPGSHAFNGIINPTLIPEIEEWKADAILIIGWAFKSHFKAMRHFKGKIPVLFRGDSTLLDEQNGIKKILRRLFLRYVYSFVDFALYVGSNNEEYFKVHGLKKSQLVYVPHAIDNERFSKRNNERGEILNELRTKLSINVSDFVVLFAGKFNQKKNPDFLLGLALHIPDENVRFVFVGNGELEKELKKKAKDSRVRFIDFQNQNSMPAIYDLCNVYILPSNGPGETWGLAINEAMACSKYVIATTKAGGAVDMINDGLNGQLIAPGDVTKATEFIRQILDGNIPSQPDDMVNEKILQKHSFTVLVKGISDLVKTI